MYSFVPIYPSGIWSWTFASSENLNLSNLIIKNYQISSIVLGIFALFGEETENDDDDSDSGSGGLMQPI